MSSVAFYGIGALAVAFLIVVHESGHFFMARWCRMRVERASLGFGPGILKHQSAKTGTIYQIAPIPFGGFVHIRGMSVAEDVDPDDPFAYPNKPVWQRFLAVLGGPLMNYAVATVIAFVVYALHGVPGPMHVSVLTPGYDADGKILVGDHITAVDGVPLPDSSAPILSPLVNARQGIPMRITVVRDGATRDITLQPKLVLDPKTHGPKLDSDQHFQFLLGIGQAHDLVSIGVGEAAGRAVMFPVHASAAILGGFYDIITGAQPLDAGGPKRMAEEAGSAFDRGFFEGLELVMALSVYLGLFNLLPLPALDGGRLAFLGYEMVTRRRANPKIESAIHMAGILVFFVLIFVVSLHDCHLF